MKLITLWFTSVYILNTHATKEAVQTFKLHMLDHKYLGCPINSKCTQSQGQLLNQWNSILSNKSISHAQKFVKKNGLPLVFWSTSYDKSEKDKPPFIQWDSFCENHNPIVDPSKKKKEDKNIVISQVMSKNFLKTQNSYKEHYFKEILTLGKNKRPVVYTTSRKDLPLYSKKNTFIFNRETNGNYYTYSLRPNGEIKIINSKSIKNYPISIKCPADLISLYPRKKYPKNLYQAFHCQKLWDIHSNSYKVIMYPRSCL